MPKPLKTFTLQLDKGRRITVVREGDSFRLTVDPTRTATLTRDEVWKLAEALDDLATGS